MFSTKAATQNAESMERVRAIEEDKKWVYNLAKSADTPAYFYSRKDPDKIAQQRISTMPQPSTSYTYEDKLLIKDFCKTAAYAEFFQTGELTEFSLSHNTQENLTQLKKSQAIHTYTQLQNQGAIYNPHAHSWDVNAKWAAGLFEQKRDIQIRSLPLESNMWRTQKPEEYSALAKEISALIHYSNYQINPEQSTQHLTFNPPDKTPTSESSESSELHQKILNLSDEEVLLGVHQYRKIYLAQKIDINENSSQISAQIDTLFSFLVPPQELSKEQINEKIDEILNTILLPFFTQYNYLNVDDHSIAAHWLCAEIGIHITNKLENLGLATKLTPLIQTLKTLQPIPISEDQDIPTLTLDKTKNFICAQLAPHYTNIPTPIVAHNTIIGGEQKTETTEESIMIISEEAKQAPERKALMNSLLKRDVSTSRGTIDHPPPAQASFKSSSSASASASLKPPTEEELGLNRPSSPHSG